MKWRNISDIFVMCIWSEFGSRFDSIADFVFAAVQEGHLIRTGKEKNIKDIEYGNKS